MQQENFIINRQSIPARLFSNEKVKEDDLKIILQSAMSAPDHANLNPLRLKLIEGKARDDFSKILRSSLTRRSPGANEATIKKEEGKPFRAQTVIVLATRPKVHPKVPFIEQYATTAMAAQNILLTCDQLGYGAILVTGASIYDPIVRDDLGFDKKDHLFGYIYLGCVKDPKNIPIKKRLSFQENLI